MSFPVAADKMSQQKQFKGERVHIGSQFQRDGVHLGGQGVVTAGAGDWPATLLVSSLGTEGEQEVEPGNKISRSRLPQ